MTQAAIKDFAARLLRREPCVMLLHVEDYLGRWSVGLAATDHAFDPYVGCGHTGLAGDDLGDVTVEAIVEIVSYALQWECKDPRRSALVAALGGEG